MANNAIWIEKFKISDELKSEFEKSSQSKNGSFLVWCLENGHLDEDAYLAWASEEFQIPILSKSFFENEDARTQWLSTWETARVLNQWNEAALPLEQYDDFVRVGCIEIPELKLDRSVGYVLAPLSGLRSLWREVVEAPVALVEAPVAIALPPVPENSVVTKPEIVEVVAELPPPPPSQEFDANSLMGSWGGGEESPAEEALPDTPVEEEPPAQMPDGFAMKESFSAVDIPLPTFSAPKAEVPVKVEAQVETPMPPPIPVPEVVEQKAPAQAVVVKANPPIPPMSPSVNKGVNPDIIGMIELRGAKDNLEDCLSLSEVANFAFSKFSRYFDRHMILTTKGFELRPAVWAGNWAIRSTKPSAVNLEQPGIFRIASRTKLPYHGYTKPSVANDFFFAEWNNGASPTHVTIIPIMAKDQVIGMFLGATDANIDAKVALMDAERWLAEIAPHIVRTKSLPAKAAA